MAKKKWVFTPKKRGRKGGKPQNKSNESYLQPDIPISELGDVDVKGLTFKGETYDQWKERKSLGRITSEIGEAHNQDVISFQSHLKAKKVSGSIKGKKGIRSETEFPGFVKTFDNRELLNTNGERILKMNSNEIITLRPNKTIDVDRTILNTMMCWETDKIQTILNGLINIKDNKIDDKTITVRSVVGVLQKIKKTDRFKHSSVSSRISVVYLAIQPMGLLVRKKVGDGTSSNHEYSISEKIFDTPYKVIFDAIKGRERKGREAAAKRKKEKDEEEKRIIKLAEEAEAKRLEKEAEAKKKVNNIDDMEAFPDESVDKKAEGSDNDLSEEDNFKQYIIDMNVLTEDNATKLIDMDFGLLMSLVDLGKSIATAELNEEKENSIINDFDGINDVPEGTPIPKNPLTESYSTMEDTTDGIDEIIRLTNTLPRGCKIIKLPDGTLEVYT